MTTRLSRKKVHRVEAHWHFGKENVSGAAVGKGGDTDSVLGYEWPIIINFLEKGANFDSAFSCRLLNQNHVR